MSDDNENTIPNNDNSNISRFGRNKKGQIIRIGQKRSLIHAYETRRCSDFTLSHNKIVESLSVDFGISKRVIFGILREYTTTGTVTETIRKGRKSRQLDAYENTAIVRTVHSFFFKNEIPTIDKILVALNSDPNLPHFKRTSLFRILHQLNFRFGTRQRKSLLIDRPEIIAWRRKYLQDIKKFREEGRTIYYLDETWVNANHTTSKTWIDDNINTSNEACHQGLSTGLKNPSGKGGRLIVIHIGSEKGFVPEGHYIFEANQRSDYHDEMNGQVFNDWFRGILKELDPGCVIVLDNASYHSLKIEKIPTLSNRKQDIISWLLEKKAVFDPNSLKKVLMAKVNEIRSEYDHYVVDSMAEESGRIVLRLPPYHCELNPIELVWAFVKSFVARNNIEFKMIATKKLLADGVAQVLPQLWKKCVDHVREKVESKMWEDDCLDQDLPLAEPIIINIAEDESDDEFDALFHSES